MSNNFDKAPVQTVLADGEWMRGFAMYLARDRAEADDMVQETCVAVLRSSPKPRASMRPWLAQVLRNFRRKGLREETRRRTREVGATLLREGEVESTETMLARLELQRMVSELVRDLDEPYRTTLLLRFFEGRTPAEMARAQGIPAGTVRWRLNEGLRRLRARLDEAHGGSREGWKAILVTPVAAPALGTGTKATVTVSAPFGLGKVAWLAGGALVPAMVAGLLLGRPHRDQAPSPAGPPIAQARPQAQETSDTSNKQNRMNALFGVVLPALVASTDGAASPEGQSTASPVPPRPRILRSELPDAVETALARATVGRELRELTIEPRLNEGYTTYKVTFEDNEHDLDEQIDFAADGTLLAREVEIALEDVPAVVVRMAKATLPDGTITKAELRHQAAVSFYDLENGVPRGPLRHRSEKTFYRLDVSDGGVTRRLHITEDGSKLLRNTIE